MHRMYIYMYYHVALSTICMVKYWFVMLTFLKVYDCLKGIGICNKTLINISVYFEIKKKLIMHVLSTCQSIYS